MPMPDTFDISQERFYHLPHNSVLVEEFDFLVSSIDPAKRHYSAKELQHLFFMRQVKVGKFKEFHPKPYRNFTEQDPPDKEKLRSRFSKLDDAPICPPYTIQEVYDKIQALGPEDALEWFLENRRKSFARFAANPKDKGNYDALMMTPYTTQKRWKYNWAEFVRDYIQFLSYIGIIPAYYKGWGRDNQMSGKAAFVVSKLGKKYINKEITLARLLMGYKYRNALVNLDSYPQYARKVRPFYVALQLLQKFKAVGIGKIERNLLAGFVSCIHDESEIDKIVLRYTDKLRNDPDNNLQSIAQPSETFSNEIGRFALTLSKFLIETEIATKRRKGRFTMLAITQLGEATLNGEPGRIAVSNDVIGSLSLTPIVGYLLKYFADSVRNHKTEIEFTELYESSELMKSLVPESSFKCLLKDLESMRDSPIERITKDIVVLRNLEHQFSINSSTDFSDIYDSDFVEGVPIQPHKQEIVRIKSSGVLNRTVKKLTEASLASDGEAYETELHHAIKNLIGDEYAFHLGNVGTRAQRLSDLVWKVPILFDGSEKKLLIVFEVKAGRAITNFDERKEKDNLKRTIRHFSNELTEIAGIWYIVVDGERLPKNQHGGFRGGQNLSFEEKLQDIQQEVLSTVNKPVLVSAMNIHSFIEYYKYLFQITREFGQTFTAFNDTIIQNFWIWGNLFHPVRSYSNIYNDGVMVKNTLRTQYAG